MHITFVENSIDFTSSTINFKALDSMQKNLINFAKTLAARKHTVVVYNNIQKSTKEDGINWKKLSTFKEIVTDVLIVFNDPTLLELKIKARKKYYWINNLINDDFKKNTIATLINLNYVILFSNHNIFKNLPPFFDKIPKYFLNSAVNKEFEKVKLQNYSLDKTFTTCHPLHGISWIIKLWGEIIHNKLPWAELHIYSKLLSGNETKHYKIKQIKLLLHKYKNRGIKVKKPLPQKKFIETLNQYKLHLNPSTESKIQYLSLLESQLAGIPVISKISDQIYDCIHDNESGFITNNENNFSEKIIKLLSDSNFYQKISNNSRQNRNIKSWTDNSIDFERNIHENTFYR